MSKSKYTKGPWHVEECTVAGFRKDFPRFYVKDGKDKVVSVLYRQNRRFREDAALIAAAPEMARCLLDILGEIELDTIPVKERLPIFQDIVVTLAKAGISAVERYHAD